MTFFNNFINDEAQLIRKSAREFALEKIMPFATQWEEEEWFPKSLHHDAGARGLLGVGFPEKYGGSGGGALNMVMVIEGLMEGGSTGVTVGLNSLGIALPPLIMNPSDMLVDRYIKPTIQGSLIAALAVTEPNAGSDVSGIRTRAILDGHHYVVNGAKQFITSGVRADFYTTLVRTGPDPHGGLSLMVIDKTLSGVSVSSPLKKTGWRASDTAEITFEDVRVPCENLIGAEGAGFILLMRNFQMERLALAAYGMVTANICLREASQYVKEREAFGRPLNGFQVTRHKLADMATEVLAAQTLVYQLAQRIDDGVVASAEVAMAKNFCADVAQRVSYQAVQLFGGMGYMRETLVERLSRDARLLPIGGGTQEIMKEMISKLKRY